MKFIMILVFSLMVVSCSDAAGTTKFLESQGYYDIKIKGFDMWAKGKDDWTSTGFFATSANGQRIEGAVTDKGWFAFFRPRWNLRIWKEVK